MPSKLMAPSARVARLAGFAFSAGKILIAGFGLFVLIGCGGPALPPLEPVEGRVLVDDVPLTSGQVSFAPVAVEGGKSVPPSSGQIDSSGNYKLFTGGKAGAPAGKYKVTVTPAMVPTQGAKGPPKGPYHEKYREFSKTPLQIDVPKAGGYDLKLTK